MRAEGFSCILDALYGGEGVMKLQFFMKNIIKNNKNFSCFFPYPDPDSLKMPDPGFNESESRTLPERYRTVLFNLTLCLGVEFHAVLE